MKKIICIILTICMLILPFSACKDKNRDDNTIRLTEVTHSIFYAPLYVAIENGYFKDEGLNISLSNGGGADKCMTAILSGSADVGLFGPEAAIYVHLGGRKDLPKVFAQLTKRDGSFLVSRVDEKRTFSWQNLKDKEIIAGRRGGVPAMTLEYVLNNNGLFDKQNVTLNYDIQFNLTAAAFIGGTGDYVTMFEPTASECEQNGNGYVVASVGKESGEVPYTCFCALQSYIGKNNAKIEKFVKAMYKAIDYTLSTDAEEVAKAIQGQFPATSVESLKRSIEMYKEIDAWVTNMSMTETALNNLQTIMERAGELEKRVSHDALTLNDVSDKIYAQSHKE